MRIGMTLMYNSAGFRQTVDDLVDYENAGLDVLILGEAYTFDAVSQLGYIAARTSRMQIASGILNVYSRTPTLLAMTAAGLDFVSDGRFILGLGASGPQVVEGFHGIRYDAPLSRTREVVDICRRIWLRQPLEYHGRYYHLPLSAERGGSGLGKPLKLINHPVRERIPMILAALGPQNVTMAAELFEGWEPIFLYPERMMSVFGQALADGKSRRSTELGPLEIYSDTSLRITTTAEENRTALDYVRKHLALYIGGMGAKNQNFYNELAARYGFADSAAKVQDLYLSGRKSEAAATLPDELVRGVSLIGSKEDVAERLRAFERAGVTTINVRPLARTHAQRVKDIEDLKQLCG